MWFPVLELLLISNPATTLVSEVANYFHSYYLQFIVPLCKYFKFEENAIETQQTMCWIISAWKKKQKMLLRASKAI